MASAFEVILWILVIKFVCLKKLGEGVKRIISILSLCLNMLNNGSPLRDEIQICEIEKGDDLQLKAIAMDSSNGSLVGITDGCNGNSIYWQSSNGEISENLSFRPVLIHAFKMIDSTPWTR